MIEIKPIKHLNDPPFIYGLRANVFMTTVIICSILITIGIFIGLFLWFTGHFLFMILAFLLFLILAISFYSYRARKSRIKDFESLKNETDVVSHINFSKLKE